MAAGAAIEPRLSHAARAALTYAFWAVVWIVASDLVLSRIHLDGAAWPIAKGLFFVAFTATILHRVVVRHDHDVREADARARDEVRDLLAQSTDLMFVVDLDGRFLMVNDAMGVLLGCAPTRGPWGVPERDFIERAGSAEHHRANDLIAIANDSPVVAYETHTKGGETRHYRATKFPIRDSTGRTYAVGGLSLDVTVESRLRAELAETASAYELMFQGNPNPMVVIDLEDLRYLDANPAAVRMYGYTRAEFAGLSTADLRPPEDRARFLAHMAARSDVDEAGVWTHVTKSGRRVEVDITSVTITYDGRPAVLVLIRDVTAAAHHRRCDELLLSLGVATETATSDELVSLALEGLRDLTYSASAELVSRADDRPPLVVGDVLDPADADTLEITVERANDTAPTFPRAVLGVVRLRGKAGGYDESDTQAVLTTVRGLGRLIARQLLIAALTEASERQAQTIEGITKAVGAMVEMRDPYTAGHQQRVGDLAVELGRILGLDDDRLEGLQIGGYLHDVGKIGVPSDVLTKTGALSPIERDLIRQHSGFGYRRSSRPFPFRGPSPTWPASTTSASTAPAIRTASSGERDPPRGPHHRRGRCLRRDDVHTAVPPMSLTRGRGLSPSSRDGCGHALRPGGRPGDGGLRCSANPGQRLIVAGPHPGTASVRTTPRRACRTRHQQRG